MRKRVVLASKRLALAAFVVLVISTNPLFGQQAGNKAFAPPINDQRVILGDDHQHGWDDLRLLLVTITDVDNNEIHWKHQTPFETKTGYWHVGKTLSKSDRGIKSDRIHSGKEFVAVYCGECQTVIWLYDGR